jgi:hypothetical protein
MRVLFRIVAWNLLLFRRVFGRIACLTRTPAQNPINKLVLLCSILGDSHGKDGRRGLEDGERQRSQIR